jgi:outer membrane protein assembly factor BamE (lipoprotein component of BamABCDE complex)
MSKKWWLVIVVILLLAVALVLVSPALLPPTLGVTYANYSRIEKGMTQEQVEQLLGKPPAKIHHAMEWFGVQRVQNNGEGPSLHWQSEQGDLVSVQFDKDGRVAAALWNDFPDDRSSLEKLRDRMPWIATKPSPPMIFETN